MYTYLSIYLRKWPISDNVIQSQACVRRKNL